MKMGCNRGYYGESCELPCPLGKYGRRCGGVCACSKTECHNVYGCQEQPKPKNEFNMLYLILGICVMITLLLIVILVHLCKKSKSSKRRSSCKMHHESSKQPSNSDHTVEIRMKNSGKQNKCNQPLMFEFYENAGDYLTIAEQSGTDGNSSTQFSIEAENADSSYQLRNMTMELSYLSKGSKYLYSHLGQDLFPEAIRSGNTEEKHVYLDVIQDE